ncbi:LysE family translocator [Phyllobacterium sp. P30BS-XVII]|uniref:LysE family translocator n=1 Tax=Phyllobacterium sp. P30BS-XVII TaxID=2587046 RepID=UPI0015FB3800|nr:LysE family translocator [Phyllobacterium sp. P30BS-XVII]MBA8901279.1 threonine/homoserine/homoserine lactone efflux protein [Phyllobacterium sp. P30BS-XVII]
METTTIILFAATVLPLICTPGPDMLFVASQSLSEGPAAGLQATAGICLGYVVHSILVALGVAAVIAASPVLFEALRWLGVAYLIYLAFQLIRSATMTGKLTLSPEPGRAILQRGFLTAVLNPKGMMIYFAILPQFMSHTGSIALQAGLLSAIFVALCGIVYTILSTVIGGAGRRGNFSDRSRRMVEGGAGGLLIVAAGFMALR